jgi:dihydroorotate dehydrogenase (NAD+) catalytic subunit
MKVNIRTMKPSLSTITGGLSGPAVKPVALRMVWQVANAVRIPVIGLGGIMNANDAIEFFLAGADAVQIGTASFIEPGCSVTILEGIEKYLKDKGFSDIKEIVGLINKNR